MESLLRMLFRLLGPSLFFAQRIDANLNECNSGTQTIQVAWNGGVTPYISGDTESDLFQYYLKLLLFWKNTT